MPLLARTVMGGARGTRGRTAQLEKRAHRRPQERVGTKILETLVEFDKGCTITGELTGGGRQQRS
jgi:hypothetical protein